MSLCVACHGGGQRGCFGLCDLAWLSYRRACVAGVGCGPSAFPPPSSPTPVCVCVRVWLVQIYPRPHFVTLGTAVVAKSEAPPLVCFLRQSFVTASRLCLWPQPVSCCPRAPHCHAFPPRFLFITFWLMCCSGAAPPPPALPQIKVQRAMERILYIWAIRHPASGYVQGINDLLTPLYVVFLSAHVGEALLFARLTRPPSQRRARRRPVSHGTFFIPLLYFGGGLGRLSRCVHTCFAQAGGG